MNILKSIITINTIMCIRLISGLYYKISPNKLVTALAKTYCVFVSLTIISTSLYTIITYYRLDAFRVGFQTTYYAANFFANILCNSEKFPAFLNKLRNLDKLQDEIPVSRVLFIIFLGARISSHVFVCSGIKVPCVFIILILDLVTITTHFKRIMMFEALWHRMKLIRKRFERESRVPRLEDGEDVIVQRLKKCLNAYGNLLTTTQDTDATMKPMIFFTVLAVIPKSLNTIYSAISRGEIFRFKATLLEGLADLSVSLAPAVFAEMVTSEVDKLKLCFAKQLLFCREDTTRDAIEDAMMYFQQRTFKFTIWRLFSVDMRLILSVISLLTTYTVALLQFTHYYD